MSKFNLNKLAPMLDKAGSGLAKVGKVAIDSDRCSDCSAYDYKCIHFNQKVSAASRGERGIV